MSKNIERVERKGTNSAKYSPRALEGLCGNPNAEPFWVADMDLASPPKAREELIKLAQLGTYGYPAFEELDEIFLQWVQKRHSLSLSTSNVAISPGILASIAVMTELLPKEDIIIPMPAYKPFVDIASKHNRKIHKWTLSYDNKAGRFDLDFDELEKIACSPGKKVLYFCSPHNPSGRVWSKEELTKTAEICKKHDIIVFSDEIHCDLTFPSQKHIPFIEIANEVGLESVTFMAPSKTFNIAGEHFSATIFSNEQRKQQFKNYLDKMRIGEISLFSGTAASACYKYGYDWLMEVTAYLEENAKAVNDYIKAEIPQIKFIMPQASFITFLDCSEVRKLLEKSRPGLDLVHFLGQEASVAVNAGPWFGEGYDDFVRFNYGTDREHILKALARIKEAICRL